MTTPEDLAPLVGPDPLATFATALVYVNLAAAVGLLVVLAVRIPVRRLVGPQVAYALWALPLLATGGALAVFVGQAPDQRLAVPAPGLGLTLVWAAGAALAATVFAIAQARFVVQLRRGLGGPAVVGLISPRIVMPADDGRYTPEERDLIRAHERQHIARKDTRAVALLALVRCLFWYNPLIHLAAGALRLDQELACDAGVVLSRPGARALYARTLLKTQLAGPPMPLGCYWSALGPHPLEVRVALLKRRAGGGRGGAVGVQVNAIRP